MYIDSLGKIMIFAQQMRNGELVLRPDPDEEIETGDVIFALCRSPKDLIFLQIEPPKRGAWPESALHLRF